MFTSFLKQQKKNTKNVSVGRRHSEIYINIKKHKCNSYPSEQLQTQAHAYLSSLSFSSDGWLGIWRPDHLLYTLPHIPCLGLVCSVLCLNVSRICNFTFAYVTWMLHKRKWNKNEKEQRCDHSARDITVFIKN